MSIRFMEYRQGCEGLCLKYQKFSGGTYVRGSRYLPLPARRHGPEELTLTGQLWTAWA